MNPLQKDSFEWTPYKKCFFFSFIQGKSAKLIALQKSGKLVGSLPLAKKRSQRRLKKKQAEAKLAANAV